MTRVTKAEHLAGVSLVHVAIATGRTHQIRVHLAAIGHPVLGDDRYGQTRSGPDRSLGLKRLFLHASGLELRHPLGSRTLRLHAPLPGELRGVLARLGPPEFGASARKT